jgi:hypothetical protein
MTWAVIAPGGGVMYFMVMRAVEPVEYDFSGIYSRLYPAVGRCPIKIARMR